MTPETPEYPEVPQAPRWVTPEEFAIVQAQARAQVAAAPWPDDASVLHGLRNVGRAKEGRVRRGGDRRGGSNGRRQRRQTVWSQWGGPGRGYVACVHCGLRCHVDPVNVECYERFDLDKIIDSTEGGTYRVDNLLPACPACNRGRARRPTVLGGPAWGDPVRNAMRVAVAHGLPYDPGFSVGRVWRTKLILGEPPS